MTHREPHATAHPAEITYGALTELVAMVREIRASVERIAETLDDLERRVARLEQHSTTPEGRDD